jgi:hypothetical protein
LVRAAFPETLTTEHILDLYANLEPPEAVGDTPFGGRSIFIVKGGTFEGPKLRGTLRPGGGDWLLSRPDGAAELDVRATLQTDEGALIYLHYRGILDITQDVLRRVFSGEDVPLSEYYFRTSPRFEAGNEKYAWLNKVVCVGVGCFAPNRVAYRVFAVR